MEKKTEVIHIRIDPEEKLRWQEAARRDEFERLSPWIRYIIRTRIKGQEGQQTYQEQEEKIYS